MRAFSYTRAATPADVVDQLSVPGRQTTILSGGMDLLDLFKEGLEGPDVVVSLADLASLKGIEHLEGGGALIGARTTLAELAAAEGLLGRFPAVARAAGKAATPQIRNRATIAGNLLQRPRCWYYRKAEFSCLKTGGQGCPGADGESRYLAILGGGPCYAVHASSLSTALVALDATLHILGPEGAYDLPVADIFVSPDEDPTTEHRLGPEDLILAISLPAPVADSANTYEKVRHKEAYDWAMAEVAVWLRLAGGVVQACRIVMGGVAPIPWRAHTAESFLIGKAPGEAALAEAARRSTSGAQPLGDNAYKVPIAQHTALEALRGALAQLEARHG